jgi:hypothetical protein
MLHSVQHHFHSGTYMLGDSPQGPKYKNIFHFHLLLQYLETRYFGKNFPFIWHGPHRKPKNWGGGERDTKIARWPHSLLTKSRGDTQTDRERERASWSCNSQILGGQYTNKQTNKQPDRHKQIHRQKQGNLIRNLSFFQNRESRSKFITGNFPTKW